ncbi:hypothetical protein FIBSPDRAFT_869774 [Athelia psychrophila]|uniref:Uncharacterized protein n=1 Tax=Athelia psychrophila TaxID=1759441 RepID=A0A166BVL8_9AGAM|nr:hypothetical protein FIBSPDRAFT_869774 [Fibularhizoctonia sp. CBS 109695]
MKPTSTSLPPSLTSLYRIFLRTISASVLHQSRSTRSIRRLYRPEFEAAVNVIHTLQVETLDSAERVKSESWLGVWNTRMDATLDLLYSSSQSRGLSHKLTQNMALLSANHARWSHKHFDTPSGSWRPNLAPNAPEYQPRQTKGRSAKEHKRQEGRAFDRNAWGAIGEAVMMAEGSQNISLGKILRNKRTA